MSAIAAVKLAAALVLPCLWIGCSAHRIIHPETLPDFHAMVATDDGWQVATFHVPPAPGTETLAHHGTPVLLAHGTCVNRMNLSFSGSDMARHLSSNGFDVWLLEYRGDRTSSPPDARTWRQGDWDADDIAGHDIPAVLAHIRQHTGREQVFWLGHSLGGILGYIVAQGPHGGSLAGLVAVGAPGALYHPNDAALFAARHSPLLPRATQLPTRPLTRFLMPTVRFTPDAYLLHLIFNVENNRPERLLEFAAHGMENTASGLTRQYAGWIRHGPLKSRDGTVDYSAGLANIQVPTLLLAGRVDHIVPAWTVRYAYDHIGSTDKTEVILGVGWGTRFDYGHGDLMVGDRAAEEVFPIVVEWLVAHAAGAED